MLIRHYPKIVEGEAESGYGVLFVHRPAALRRTTPQEAALHTEEALPDHLALMLDAGDSRAFTYARSAS
jgi:hypothetical protein